MRQADDIIVRLPVPLAKQLDIVADQAGVFRGQAAVLLIARQASYAEHSTATSKRPWV